MDNLFETEPRKYMPLAARMRPRNLYEYMGQKEVVGEGTLLRKAIEEDVLGSLILFGPPGCGKTTLAEVIAAVTRAHFIPMSAITAGKADIMNVVREAENRLRYDDKKTILFIDEIHRFNKSQQDALLPAVEQGKITFIGATTENPYFEVNRALISRARIIPLQPLTKEDIKDILIGALEDEDRGLGRFRVEYDDEPLDVLAELCGGDARVALNAVETVVSVLKPDEDGKRRLRSADIEEVLQRKIVRYDKSGDSHYDVTSAFIKSMRGSDPDAAVHYLARMIEAGEDMEFVARRIIICAAEDVGMADPNALNVAVSAFHALRAIGMPEARIPLAEATIYVATAPKSNRVINAIDAALADVRRKDTGVVPVHIRDGHNGAVKKGLGHSLNYRYPHDYPGGYVKQQYMPDALKGTVYYEPTEHGREKYVKERLEYLKKDR